jgi:hypothetical protein
MQALGIAFLTEETIHMPSEKSTRELFAIRVHVELDEIYISKYSDGVI